jgi:hypothetical protein
MKETSDLRLAALGLTPRRTRTFPGPGARVFTANIWDESSLMVSTTVWMESFVSCLIFEIASLSLYCVCVWWGRRRRRRRRSF